MAKRHHGYKMRDREQYAGREETKMMMSRDSMMIKEDAKAACHLPTHVIEKEWPRGGSYDTGMVDTLFNGVQKQLKTDASDLMKTFKPSKY